MGWKIVGMMVGCYGLGYWLASRRLQPELVAVGLVGKVLGPLGFVWAAATGRLPLWFGLVVLANDVIWWPAFAGYLLDADTGSDPGTCSRRRAGRPRGRVAAGRRTVEVGRYVTSRSRPSRTS